MYHPSVKRVLSFSGLYFIAIFCISIMGCDIHKEDHAAKHVFHLNYSSGTVETADPAFAKDLYCMWTDHMIYNTLVETDSSLHLIPSLARRWEVSADGLTYTFHLRSDAYFQDAPEFAGGKGRRMTAADVGI